MGKPEHLAKGANPRFVVTSLSTEAFDARCLHEEQYCARGDMENRIKEQQLCLFADRTADRRGPRLIRRGNPSEADRAAARRRSPRSKHSPRRSKHSLRPSDKNTGVAHDPKPKRPQTPDSEHPVRNAG